jgi:serine/threonine-protein kinase
MLDGRYRILGLLGQGGMGTVYSAEDLRLGRKVAVKVVRQVGDEALLGERLFREAKAAARAEHPAVITAFGYGTDQELGADYFVMEQLHGETLGQRIERVGPLPVALALRIAIEVCDTPMFMAPEQLNDSKRVDARADLYALGAVIFECLTGRVPFLAPNALALLFAIMEGPSPDVRSLRSDVPDALAAIVTRCLQRDRAQRFADTRALYIALGRVAA